MLEETWQKQKKKLSSTETKDDSCDGAETIPLRGSAWQANFNQIKKEMTGRVAAVRVWAAPGAGGNLGDQPGDVHVTTAQGSRCSLTSAHVLKSFLFIILVAAQRAARNWGTN